jgi:hypothetical protein
MNESSDDRARAMPRDLSRRTAGLLIVALTVLALAARLSGIGFMLPHQPEPDAVIVWQAAEFEHAASQNHLERASPPNFYPHLLGLTLSILPGHSVRAVLPAERPLAEHLAAASEPYVRGRWLIAFLSVIAIPATYALARTFLPRAASLFAAAFMATSLLDLAYAQQARPHCASASLSLLAVLAALRVLRVPSVASFVLAGVAAFFAVGALHNGVFVLPAIAVAFWAAPRRHWIGITIVAGFVVLSVVFFYPFLFYTSVPEPSARGVDVGGQSVVWSHLSLVGFVRMARGLWSYDPILVAFGSLGAIGVAVAAVRGRLGARARPALVAAAFPAAFLLFWGCLSIVWPRFTIPLVPYLALGAAIAGNAVFPALVPRDLAGRPRAFAYAALACAVLAVPAIACAKLAHLRSIDDTVERAAGWIENVGDRERDVVSTSFLLSLPLFSERATIAAQPDWSRGPWDEYQLAFPAGAPVPAWKLRPLYRAGFMADKHLSVDEVRSVVAEDQPTLAVAVVPTAGALGKDDTCEALRAAFGEPELSLEPYDRRNTQLFGSAYELGYHAFERIMTSSVWGPPLEFYRVRR